MRQNGSMSDPSGTSPRPDAPELAKGANSQMIKTVGLLIAAFILGIVMLNVIEPGDAKSAKSPKTTTSTTIPKGAGGTTSTTKSNVNPGGKEMTKSQIRVIVLNASGVNKVAATMSASLKKVGYTTQEAPGTALTTRKGTAVQCRADLGREAATLVRQVQNKAKVEPFPLSLPKTKDGKTIPSSVQCIVILGKSG